MLVRPDDEERDAAAYRQAVETEAANSTSQSWQDLLALDACRGSFSLASQVEKLHYAAILLREQGRIEQILRDRDVAPSKRELIWVALYPHLLACGYTLPRPYAFGTPGAHSVSYTLPLQRRGMDRPLDMVHYNVLPATTMKHGKQRRVALKIVCTRPGTDSAQELETLEYLNAEPVRSHPDNIAVQLLDVLHFPEVDGQPRAKDLHIIVMPLLRPFSKTDSGAIGLVVELMRRMFRGLAFLHSLGIAHGDIGYRNFMLSSSGPLPAPCLIDFQLSRRFENDTQSGEDTMRQITWIGGQIPPPEVRDDPERPYDPFSADIYALAYIWAGGFGPPAGAFPTDAEHLLRRMLSPTPDERPASAGECVVALESALPRISFRTRCRPYPLLRSALRFAARNGQYSMCADYGWKYVRGLAYMLVNRARVLQ